MRRAVRTILFFVVACVCAGKVAAQEEIDDARKAKIDLDGLYITPTLQLKEFGVDTNVFNLSGQQTPDFTFTLTPAAKLDLPIARRALIESNVNADLVYFAHYASERSVDPGVTIRATGFFPRIKLFTEGDYVNSRQRVNQEIDARARRTDKNVQAGIEYELVPKFSVSLAGRAGSIDYAEDQSFNGVDLRESLAENQRTALIAFKYKATPLTTFVLKGDVQEDRFLFSTFKDGDSYRVMPGVEFKPRALISGSAYIGFRELHLVNSSVPGFQGAVAQTSLRYSLRSATAFTLTVDRDVQYSYEDIDPYYVNTDVGFSVRRQLVGAFDTTLQVQRFHYTYQDAVQLIPPLPQRIDITHNYGGDIGYRLGRTGRLGVGLSYWTRESNRVSTANYQGFRFGSSVSYGF